MARKVSKCEHCGDDLGYEVEKHPGDIVVCVARECQRFERDCYREQRDEAHQRLDRDMGWK